MTDRTVGRVLVASLHQAVAEVIPSRLEFYESWLNPAAPRPGHAGLAPLSAALSFLRQEGEAYGRVASRAGEYAAEWTVADLSALRRRMIASAPPVVRRRLVVGLANALAQRSYGASAVRVQWSRHRATVVVDHSPFCDVRRRSEQPLCGFYATALGELMRRFGFEVEVAPERCRATDPAARACGLSIVPRSREGEAA